MTKVIQTEMRSKHQGPAIFEQLQKYVRVRSSESDRFVEFDFAVGEPSLFVELIMPKAAFERFCQVNEVMHMTEEQMHNVDAEMEKWRYGADTFLSRHQSHTSETHQFDLTWEMSDEH